MFTTLVTSRLNKLMIMKIFINFEKPFCNGCHDISMMCYELENIEIFKIKGFGYWCILRNIAYDEAFNLLKNSKLDERGSL